MDAFRLLEHNSSTETALRECLAMSTKYRSLVVIGERYEGVAVPNAQGERRD